MLARKVSGWNDDVIAAGPALRPAGAGVVFRQREGNRVFLIFPMLRRPAQIPGSRLEIDFRVEQFLHPKILDAIFLGPFLRRLFAHLHQAAFPGAAEFLRIETAFAPDDRLHQHRIEMMLGRHGSNQRVVLLETRRD